MKFVLLINLKLLTIANSFLLNIAENEKFSANEYENANWHFGFYQQRNFEHEKSLYHRPRSFAICRPSSISVYTFEWLLFWKDRTDFHQIKFGDVCQRGIESFS